MQTSTPTPERTEGRRAIGGILILLGLGVLAILIISLDEILASRVETVDLITELPESEGLVSGNAVWIAGLEVGEVVTVTLLPPEREDSSRIIAVARIPAHLLPLIRRDSRADITKRGLMGDPVLDLDPGSAPFPVVAGNDTLRAEYGPDRVGIALVSARRTAGAIDSLADNLRSVAALFAERRPMIDRVRHSADRAAAELDRTQDLWRSGPLPAALRDARLAERFGALRDALATVRSGLARYTEGPLGEQLAILGASSDSLRADVARLDSLASDPNAGFVGRFRADSAIAVEAARTSAQLDTLVEEITSNPFMFY